MSAQPLEDPLILPQELDYSASISQQNTAGNLVGVAAALGAAFYGYRWYMQRRLREELKGTQPTSAGLRAKIEEIYAPYDQVWMRTILPHLVSGYAEGLIDVSAGNVSEEVLLEIAEAYASNLGRHLNEVSADAMVSGYQAQLNRRVPPQRALNNVVDAFGVNPRAMNSLVTVWTSEEAKVTSDVVPINHKARRAEKVIDDAVKNRAKVLGETESWSTRTQAKQIVWMYGVETGAISPDTRRRWVTAKDELVCPTCGPMHHEEVTVGSRFDVPGYGQVWSPPLHPNCRCDIELDLDYSGGMARQVRESVGKSRENDPAWMKRDASGQFATQEQQKAPERTQTQASQSQQVRNRFESMAPVDWSQSSAEELGQALEVFEQVLSSDAELSPQELEWMGAQLEQISNAKFETTRAKVQIGAPRAKVKTDQTRERARVSLGRPQEQRAKVKMEQAQTRTKVSLGGEQQRAKVSLERAKVSTARAQPRGENPGLYRFERPAYTMVTPTLSFYDRNRLGREMYETSDANPWTTRTDLSWSGPEGQRKSLADQVERYWRTIKQEDIQAHWEEFHQGLMDQNGQEIAEFHDWDYEGATALIPRGMFDEAWDWVMAGAPMESNVEYDVSVEGAYGTLYGDTIDLDFLAERFGMYELQDELLPVILMTEYADTNAQDYNWADGADYGTVAGRWKFMDEAFTQAAGVRLPHRLVVVAPEFMDD